MLNFSRWFLKGPWAILFIDEIIGMSWSNYSTPPCCCIPARNPTIFIIIRCIAWSMWWMTCWPCAWCPKHYFFFIIYYRLKTQKWKDFCKESTRNYETKMILLPSDNESFVPATHRVILKIVGFLVQRRYTSEREIPEGCHLWVTKI